VDKDRFDVTLIALHACGHAVAVLPRARRWGEQETQRARLQDALATTA
jgi:hypothetical protein